MSKSGIPIVSDIAKAAKPLAPILSAVLPFVPIPGFAGLSPLLTRSLLAGGIGGLSGGKGFDLKRGLLSGLMSYGIGSLGQGAGSAANAASGAERAVSGANAAQGLASNIDPGMLEGMSANQVLGATAAMPSTAAAQVLTPQMVSAGAPGQPPVLSTGVTTPPPAPNAPPSGFVQSIPRGVGANAMDFARQTGENIAAAGKGLYNMATGAPGAMDAFKAGMTLSPKMAIGATFAGAAGMKTVDELNAQKAQAEKILADTANRKQEEINWAKGVMRDYPMMYQRLTAEGVQGRGFAGGGITMLAPGGQARFLTGRGDGMSDSIPATIEGRQPARLADGEFVVPADVVSHIGNGSSKAGAQKLYKMMDRVRMARTGNRRQAPQIKTERHMPA